MGKWLSLYMSFFFWRLYNADPASCSQYVTDRLALLSFKQAIEKDPFQLLSSWNDSKHYCLWPGIYCSPRNPERVSALLLIEQGLVGSLSPQIGNLSFLRIILLENNSFHGEIPPEIGRLQHLEVLSLTRNYFVGDIPISLSNCSKLELLHLDNNKLTGSIPTELGSLSKLLVLNLAENKLSGTVPPSIGNISSLEELILEINHLEGQVPDELSRLHKVFNFRISDNNLTGEIPRGLYNMSSLQIFEIYDNHFEGTIPSDIGLTLPRLSHFAVAFNRFTGSIPITLTNASVLQNFAFNSNNFTGSIPKDFGKMPLLRYVIFSYNLLQGDLSFFDSLSNCSHLEQLNVAGNFLNGSIPKSIGNLSTNMIYLALEKNYLQNTIPLGLENLVNLRFLHLGSNFLSGRILISFRNMKQLQHLTLHSNNLTGTIPFTLGNLSFLTYLDMSSNNLHGTIPPSLGSSSGLIALDLSNNNLNGSIPLEILRLSSLSIALLLSGNKLDGSIPPEVGFLSGVSQLDLSNNRLSGKIPGTIGKCLKMEQLYLEGNSFDGDLPQSFSALRGLRELDISHNNLSGKIPNSLVTLNGLKLLNLSFNAFEGQVPKGGIFLNASAVLLLGNKDLCGGIAELKLPSCVFPKSKKNQVSSALKVSISMISAGVCLVLLVCFFFFWYRKRMSRRKDAFVSSFNHEFMRLSYAELAKATDGFSTSNLIGSGHYSSVYKGILDQTGIDIAVKVINMQQRGASSSFMSECKALRNIRHRNLMKLLSACSSIDFKGNDFKALVYEFMPNGSLEKWLHLYNSGEDEQQIRASRNLKLMQRLNIAIDIASAIEYLHNACPSTIVHGDLKPSNVLLDDEMTAHVGDFGVAKIVSTMSGGLQLHQSSSVAIEGTIGYVAPEYGMGDMVSIEGDVYSYGILLLEMFTGKKPTDDCLKDELNLHVFVERCLPHRVTEIVDPSILSGDERLKVITCLVSVLGIGVACSMETPAERMKMVDVVRELQKTKDIYQNRQQRRNNEGPSTSQLHSEEI